VKRLAKLWDGSWVLLDSLLGVEEEEDVDVEEEEEEQEEEAWTGGALP